MAELIEKLNELFGSDTTEQDQLSYVNGTIFGKVMQSPTLQQQASNNSKECIFRFIVTAHSGIVTGNSGHRDRG
jgi:hypothetical protein